MYKFKSIPSNIAGLVACGFLLIATGCGSDSDGSTGDGDNGAGDGDGDGDTSMAGAPSGDGDDSAILVAVFVRTPEGRNVYVGAEPKVPTGELDYSDYLEFGDVEANAHGGYVFVWDREPATMTRYDVTSDLQLDKGPTLSFREEGAGNATGFGATVYVSETRAYTLSSALDTVIVWDPKAMELTGTIDMNPPERAEGLETYPSPGHVVGDSVIWPLRTTQWDGENYFPGVAVAVANANTSDPGQIVEDDRCVGSDGSHVDENGDLYLRAGGYWGSAAAYGEDAADVRTCVLRIREGETTFDPDYLVDMKDLTGSYVNFPWFHVKGSKYLAQVWDPETPLPESMDDYWDGAGLDALLVDIDTGDSEPYPDVEGYTVVSSVQFELDGVSYFQLSETSSAVEGSADVVELHPSGIEKTFTLPELWALERIR